MEHRWAIESVEYRKVTPAGDTVKVMRHRYVCDCGHATAWYLDERRANRMAGLHAVDGQLTLDLHPQPAQ